MAREVDKRPYTVTFQELNQMLKRFGYELVNPSGNYIDLVRVEYVPTLLGLGRRKRQEVRLAKVGSPGWKRQITRGGLNKLREAARLTEKYGYDSKVLFEGADPLAALISMYEDPLKRLADR